MSKSLSENWDHVEHGLLSLLARIERRQNLAPAMAEDGVMNQTWGDNLRQAVRLTDHFRAVYGSGASSLIQANRLAECAHATTHMLNMARALENAPRLSPCFERLMNREYSEIVNLMAQAKDAIVESSHQLIAAAENNPPVDPVTAAWEIMTAPCEIAYGMIGALNNVWITPSIQSPRAATHLKLVYSRN